MDELNVVGVGTTQYGKTSENSSRVNQLITLFLFLVLLASASAQVERSPEFEDLFDRKQGWTGADGTYSVPFNGGTMWLFSDTFFGRVLDGSRVDTQMLNNSMILQKGS